jgi:trimethylamine--corrinoid protein Co-methyltransferase
MKTMGSADVLTENEIRLIHNNALRILSEVGMTVQNAKLLKLLADHGAVIDLEKERVWFPEKLVEKTIAESSGEFDDADGLEVSCLFPSGNRTMYSKGVECTAGTYPANFLDIDGSLKPHTVETAAKMTRLADYLPNIDRLGVMGVPSDIPGLLGPLYERLIAWKNAEKKLSNSGEVHDVNLIPYIFEMGEVMADFKKAPLRRYTFAEVELIAPLQFTRVEAEIFVRFWEKGLLAGIGFMYSAGGSAPATLAAVVSLMVAESLFICILYRLCYGFRKLYLQANSSVMDMKRCMFAFGRPERGLMILAMGQMARYYNAAYWGSAAYADAKQPSCEAGMQCAFNAIPAVIAGSLGIECFGVLSGGEIGSAVQLVIDNEFAGGLKRFARGFNINEETLAFDLIKEKGPGGLFTDTEHTVTHYRTEHWQPEIFSREGMNAWRQGDKKIDVDAAKLICETVFRDYHPRGIDEATEKKLVKIIKRAEKKLR